MATYELVDLRDSSGIQFHNVIDVDGQRVNTFKLPPDEVAEIIHNLVNLPIRDDDVMLCAPARSGMTLYKLPGFCPYRTFNINKIDRETVISQCK